MHFKTLYRPRQPPLGNRVLVGFASTATAAATADVGCRKWEVGGKEEALSSLHPTSAIPHSPSNGPRTPTPAPTTRPLVRIDFSLRLTHRIAFADEATPQRRSKPKGVMGAEVWVKLSALGDSPPSGPGDLRFLLLATRSPAIVEYSGNEAGKTAHYMVRWLNRRGEPGPWSETASATVGA